MSFDSSRTKFHWQLTAVLPASSSADASVLRTFPTRRLRLAVAASLLLHLLILWPANAPVLTRDASSTLQATLRWMPPVPAEIAPKPPVPRAVPSVPAPVRPLLKNRPTTLDEPKPSSVPQSPATAPPEPVSPATPVAAPAVATVAAAAESAGPQRAAPTTEVNASAEAVDGVRGYRLALANQARRFKRYPAQATARGWTGTAEIRVEIGSDGSARAATVLRSSGHEVLDGAALAMMDAAAARARVPDSLRGKAFAVVLPVVFKLDNE